MRAGRKMVGQMTKPQHAMRRTNATTIPKLSLLPLPNPLLACAQGDIGRTSEPNLLYSGCLNLLSLRVSLTKRTRRVVLVEPIHERDDRYRRSQTHNLLPPVLSLLALLVQKYKY